MSNPVQPLRALIIEDSPNDASLLEIELERAGYQVQALRVDTEPGLRTALQAQRWDVVIADYVMPHFNGLAALKVVKEYGLDLPFIVVSGHITDDTAVAAMKAGAHDYVMKDNLARLGPAVQRELREAEMRRERRRSEEKLKVEHAFRSAIENSVPSGIAAVDLDGRQTYVNPAFCQMVGWAEADLVGAKPPFVYWPPEETDAIIEGLSRVIEGKSTGGLELRFRRRTQERIHVWLQVTPLRDSFGNITGWVNSVSDISERKAAEIRLAAEHAITRILANAQNLDEAAPGIVQVLLDALEVEVGTLWVPDELRNCLGPFHTNVRRLSNPLKAFLERTRALYLQTDEPGTARAWQERRTLWVTDVQQDPSFGRFELALKADLHTLQAFPIINAGDCFGVLEFFTHRALEPDPIIINMMSAIGSEIGQFIQRRAAEAALRRAHNELELRVQQRTAELKTANERLQTAISERKRLEHELLEITENERRRIGLDLHDDLGQRLSGVALMTKGLELKLARAHAQEAQEAARIHELVQEAMTHASDLAHDMATLDRGAQSLPEALEGLAAHARDLFKITCVFESEGTVPALDANAVHQLYKIAQEALTNAIKHAKASRVTLHLAVGPGSLTLTVRNNGLPFPDLSPRSGGMGLRIMTYRASLLNGSLIVKAQGQRGAVLTCEVPVG